MVTAEDIKTWVETNLPGAKATVTGDGRHFEAMIIADAFANKTMLARHRLVYAALGNHMQSTIHALSIQAYTPEEYASH